MSFGKLGALGKGFGKLGGLAGAGQSLPPLPAPSSTMVAKGDRLTLGIGTNTASWPSQLAANTGRTLTNKGVSGETLATANTNYATEIAPLYNAVTANTLLLLQGTADIRNSGTTAAQLQTLVQTYAGKARTTGFKIIVETLIPDGEVSWTGTMETHRLNYNAWLRVNWASFCDGIIDFASISQLVPADPIYYQTDLLHITNRGARLMAELVRTRFALANVNDTTPNAFSFTDVTGATGGQTYYSNPVELVGFTAATSISLTGGNTIAINAGAAVTSGTVQPYDLVQVNATASATAGASVNAIVTAGGVSDTYSVTTAAAYAGPGDVVSGADVWYGLRAYTAAYIGGPAIDVQRASDNATMTVNTVSGGGLDPALATFLTATTGKVTKIYDQTGGGRHLANVTGSQQPPIVLNAIGSKPAMNFSSTGPIYLLSAASYTLAQPFTDSVVAKHNGALASSNVILSDANTRGAIFFSTTSGNMALYSGSQTANVAAADNTFHAAQGVFNGASSSLMVDGVTTSSLNAGTDGFGAQIYLGNGTFPLNGQTCEAGVWPSGLSGANQTALNNNQRTYWGF